MNSRLALLRKTLGFRTQKDFAEVLDMPWRTLQSYEQATTSIPSTFIFKLKNQFNISANWLLFGKGEMFLTQNSQKLEFENSTLILENLTQEEIESALTTAYIQKSIYPIFKDIGAEKSFWKELIEGHRDRISAVFYLLRALKNIEIDTITVQNARQVLINTIDTHMVTLIEHCKFMYLTKDSLMQTIDKIDDLGCFIILTNAQKITEALSPFLTSAHLKDLKKRG